MNVSFSFQVVRPVEHVEHGERYWKHETRVLIDTSGTDGLVVADVEITSVVVTFLQQDFFHLFREYSSISGVKMLTIFLALW